VAFNDRFGESRSAAANASLHMRRHSALAIAALAIGGCVPRVAVIWPKNTLHDARMAGLAKLWRSIRSTDERQLWAVHVGRGEIVWQDRCDAANGSKEPNPFILIPQMQSYDCGKLFCCAWANLP